MKKWMSYGLATLGCLTVFFLCLYYAYCKCVQEIVLEPYCVKSKVLNVTSAHMSEDLQDNKKIFLSNEKISIVYLVNSLDSLRRNLMHLGGLFHFVVQKKCKIYFVSKKSNVRYLQELFDIHDIPEKIYATSNAVFWRYSLGNEPTLLVLNRNQVVGVIYGYKNWNDEEEIMKLSSIVEQINV